MALLDDYTPCGTKLEGQFENDRNAESRQCFTDVLKEVFGPETQTIIAHHIVYQLVEVRDGRSYFLVQEIPSADALIFDHAIAQRLWPETWKEVLSDLALTPVEERDARFAEHFYGREHKQPVPPLRMVECAVAAA